MAISKCRVCNNAFFKKPLLKYENMPKAAQHMPDAKSLESDKGIDLEVCQCSGCGLVQLSNDPVPYYREVIRAASISPEMADFRKKQFGEFVKKYSLKGKKIVEIGCGKGEYISIMQETGVKAYGLEYLAESVKQCNDKGLAVSKGFIESGGDRLKDTPFDAFFILNFLEHLPKINLTLAGICNNLSDGAVGLVEVPNFDMILRKKLFSEFIGDHLFYFTKQTLISTLQQNGFEVIECSEVWHDYISSAVVRKREMLDISDFYGHQTKIRNEINKYVMRFGNKKVAIWGAGHQALAVMSLTNLADKIKYVIDSAPFKQGKFTPATHILIVSPAALDTDPADAVIVMAASYSDEVTRIIREKYGKKINVAILSDFGLKEI